MAALKPLRVLTCVWGAHHTDLFLNGTIKSLSWPKNKLALDGCTWEIITRQFDAARIQSIVEDVFPNVKFEIKVVPATIKMAIGEIDSEKLDHSNIILMYLQQAIKTCLDNGAQFLLAPPDTVFSEGAVSGLRLMGKGAGTVVAVPHPRVLMGLLEDLKKPLDSAHMVDAAFKKHLHQSWANAEIGHAQQNSLVGGVSWQKLSNEKYEPLTIAVQHRSPHTVHLINFLPEDYAYFINQPSFGSYDHGWPGERHIRQERWRSVGSSDAAFIVEITEKDKNIPPWTPQHQEIVAQTSDAFYRDQLHNVTERLFVHVFRGC